MSTLNNTYNQTPSDVIKLNKIKTNKRKISCDYDFISVQILKKSKLSNPNEGDNNKENNLEIEDTNQMNKSIKLKKWSLRSAGMNSHLSSYSELAHSIYSDQLKENKIDSNFKLIGVKYVVNDELLKNFQASKNKLQNMNSSATELWLFHGTAAKNIPSICTHGFYDPFHSNYKFSNGLQYSKGIYLSTLSQFALRYSPILYKNPGNPNKTKQSKKLIVSRVLIGNVKRHGRDTCDVLSNAVPDSNYDSYFILQHKFYVVFNTAHILPVFVFEVSF